jgi:hypothetical protein
MKDFAAIDFETANFERTSVCAVGVVIVRDGEMVDSFYSLIHPEPDYYNWRCSSVNGLCREDTEDAPIFPDVWKQIEPMIAGAAPRSPQQGFRRKLPESRLPHVWHGLSRLSFLLHAHRLAHVCGPADTTTSTSSPHAVAMISRTITMLSPTPRPAQPSR